MKLFKTISVFAIVLFMSAFTINTETNLNDGYEVGDVATDFKLKNIDGKMVSLADYKDAKGYM